MAGTSKQACLNSISSSVASSLATHELEPVAEATEQAGEERPPPAVPVAEVGPEGGLGRAGDRPAEEQDVEAGVDDETGGGEVEEGGVDRQVRHAGGEGVPLVVGGQVERRGEERQAHAGEEDYPEPEQGARTGHLDRTPLFELDEVLCSASLSFAAGGKLSSGGSVLQVLGSI